MHVHRFPDSTALTQALAGEIRVDLDEAIAARGLASLVVSCGDLECRLFRALAQEKLDWSKVWITLSDECWVDTHAELSHERAVREHLLQGAAADAHFVGLKNPAATPEAGADWVNRALKRVHRPFDVVLLSMGADGQVASLFPNSLALAKAGDPTIAPGCVAIQALMPPHARISLNLAALLDARSVLLILQGSAAWQTLEHAKQEGSVAELPARLFVRQKATPFEVFWSP
jgi:6-phosphogluconolactonase